MRWERAAFLIVLGLTFSVQAQNDVMVDLSVLDGLSSSYIAPSEPMFPVLAKQENTSVSKAKKNVSASKAVRKKAVAKKKVVNERIKPVKKSIVIEPIAPIQHEPEVLPQREEDIVVVDVEPIETRVEERTEPLVET